jgi:hypothetical protein
MWREEHHKRRATLRVPGQRSASGAHLVDLHCHGYFKLRLRKSRFAGILLKIGKAGPILEHRVEEIRQEQMVLQNLITIDSRKLLPSFLRNSIEHGVNPLINPLVG